MSIAMPVALMRNRRTITATLYLLAFGVCAYLLYDPELILRVFTSNTTVWKEEDNVQEKDDTENADVYAMLGADFNPAPKPDAKTVIHLPFIPRAHTCETMFEKAGHNFTYSEFYWEHSDAFKSALQMANTLKESAVDETSWIFHEIALMPFIETVCETGFRAGHFTFHFLTAKPEIIVNSFESQRFNFTEDMATFMTAEFPDRFYFYPGKTEKVIPDFHKQNNDTKCDLFYAETAGRPNEEVESDLQNFAQMRHPKQNMFLMLSYRKGKAADSESIWNQKVKSGEILEQFTCEFAAEEGEGIELGMRNEMRVKKVFVGSFTGKKAEK